MVIKIIVWGIAVILSSITYRMGGAGKPYKSWMRDWVCPAFFLLATLFTWQPYNLISWLMLLPFYGLSGGALSTYWDWAFHNNDNYYTHGFGCGLAGFCLITFVPWWILTLRLIICSLGMGLWSKFQNNAVREELGRGAFFIL